MKEPTLIIMAAGMGSRYGGLKQIDAVSDQGEIILDFSLYDAMMAGFNRAVFIIKKENEKAFRELVDMGAGKHMKIDYAFQDIEDLPDGYEVPKERVKPWGTCHAVMSARDLIDGPFAVINADDYYGPWAFQAMHDFLVKAEDKDVYDYAMVGYELAKTITENGSVARGICSVSKDGLLEKVVERTNIFRDEEDIVYSEDGGATKNKLTEDTVVSMNFWGFTKSMMDEMVNNFPMFLDEILKNNPLKGEFYLPAIVDLMLKQGKAKVNVLTTKDKWYGVTYHEDKDGVVKALQAMKDRGEYPEKLWI